MTILVPRLSVPEAVWRFAEIQAHLRKGLPPEQLVRVELGAAVPNATGGTAPSLADIQRWREGVSERVLTLPSDGTTQAHYSKELGRAIDDVIQPSRSDVAHDGAWSYLSLMLFPDVVARRWGPSTDGSLSKDRWIGAQLGRNRNYLKLSWRNWIAVGETMDELDALLGEDEYVALLERTALARNPRLIRIAAREVISLEPGGGIGRSEFARQLMKRLRFQTGPLLLDLLDDEELTALVKSQAEAVRPPSARPRRSAAD